MGSNRNDRRQQEELRRQSAAETRLFMEAYNRSTAPDPLEERRRASSLAFLDSVEGRNGPFDVARTPGMEPHLDLYNRQKARQSADADTDTGLFQLGATGGSPNLIARMREQNNMRRDERAAGDLSNAFAGKYAEVTGNTVPFLMRYRQDQNMGLANLTSNRSTASTSLWSNFRPRPSIWSQLLTQGFGAAGQVAAAYAGNPSH